MMPLIGSVLIGLSTSTSADDLRAKVWNEITAINDRSIRDIHTSEAVVVLRDARVPFDFVRFDLRSSDRNDLVMNGTIRTETSRGEPAGTVRKTFRLGNGEIRQVGRQGDIGFIRPEDPGQVMPRALPCVLTGLGRFISPSELTTRAEHLASARDLHIVSEMPDRVTMEGNTVTSPVRDGRYFRIRIELDPRTGDVLVTKVFDTRWDTLFVQWDTPNWIAVDCCRLPITTEYRVFQWTITQEQRQALGERMRRLDLPSECVQPHHARHAEWIALRDEVLGGPLPIRLSADPQKGVSTILGVNDWHDSRDFKLPDEEHATRFYSLFLDAFVDRFSASPSGSSTIPEPVEDDEEP